MQSEQSARVTMLPCKKVLARPGRNSRSNVYSESITSFQFTTRSFLACFSHSKEIVETEQLRFPRRSVAEIMAVVLRLE